MPLNATAPVLDTPEAGNTGQMTGLVAPMIAQPARPVNPQLGNRYQEYRTLSNAVDICVARCERPDADPDDCALLRRLASIFAEHGIAAEREAA